MPVNGSDVKIVYYTRSAYNNLSTKDDNTIYYVQETNGRLSIYIGTRAMGYATEGYVDSEINDVVDYVNSSVGPKLDANSPITAATRTKITYDSKGLVTGGADLVAGDIPNLPASKTTSGTFAAARIPQLPATKITQTTSYRFVSDSEKNTWNNKQDKLTAGSGITISGSNVISATGGDSGWELLYSESGIEENSYSLYNFNALLGDYKIFAAYVLTSYEETSITFCSIENTNAETYFGKGIVSYYSPYSGGQYDVYDNSEDILTVVIWGVSK